VLARNTQSPQHVSRAIARLRGAATAEEAAPEAEGAGTA
jgi:hypothetical protein